MIYGQSIKFSNSMTESISDTMFIASHFKNSSKSVYVKGLLIRPISTIKFGRDGDDFVKDLFTVVAESKCYKVPSVFKKIYKSEKKKKNKVLL